MAKHDSLSKYILTRGYYTFDGNNIVIANDITKCPHCKKHIETSHGVWVQCRTCGTICVTYGNSIYWGRSVMDIQSYIAHRWSNDDCWNDARKNTMILKGK